MSLGLGRPFLISLIALKTFLKVREVFQNIKIFLNGDIKGIKARNYHKKLIKYVSAWFPLVQLNMGYLDRC